VNPAVSIALLGWIPLVLVLFALFPPRRAAIISFLAAWLFLPVGRFPYIGLHDKMTVTCAGVLLGTLIFGASRLRSFRPWLGDLPMLVWCLCPFVSSMTNGLGLYDAFSATYYNFVTWGAPYFIGRLYFADREGLRELAVGIFVGGLIYVPLCLWEIRMSPQLHRMVYGYQQHRFEQTLRFGGWRPMVFMQHGLMVAMWMSAASLTGIWLWTTGALKSLRRVPVAWLFPPLLVTAVLCKSVGALVLLVAGCLAYAMARWFRTALPVLCLVAVPPTYMALRASGSWSGHSLVSLVAEMTNEERAASVNFRLKNEDMLVRRSLERKAFGWGRWARSHVFEDLPPEDVSITDGLWVIALGESGLVGLTAITTTLLLPVVLLWRRRPAWQWSHPSVAPAAALAVLLALYMIDNLFNAMVNPVFTLAAGGLVGVKRGMRRPAALPIQPWPAQRPALAAQGRGRLLGQ